MYISGDRPQRSNSLQAYYEFVVNTVVSNHSYNRSSAGIVLKRFSRCLINGCGIPQFWWPNPASFYIREHITFISIFLTFIYLLFSLYILRGERMRSLGLGRSFEMGPSYIVRVYWFLDALFARELYLRVSIHRVTHQGQARNTIAFASLKLLNSAGTWITGRNPSPKWYSMSKGRVKLDFKKTFIKIWYSCNKSALSQRKIAHDAHTGRQFAPRWHELASEI